MLIIKALHLIAIVAWFAGLFYLPRLFVYHCRAQDQASKAMLSTMARRLYRFIMTPACMLVVFFGIGLLGGNAAFYMQQPWFLVKMVFVIILLVFHVACGRYMRLLARGAKTPGEGFFRWFNEVPTLCLVVIVFLVILKP